MQDNGLDVTGRGRVPVTRAANENHGSHLIPRARRDVNSVEHCILTAIAQRMEADLEQQQRDIEGQIAALAPRIAQQKEFLRKRLGALYRLGRLSYVRLLLSLDNRRDPLEVLLAVRLEGTDDGIPVSHDFYRNVGKIGGPERVLDMLDPQVLVDAAQGLSAQPTQAGDQQADEELRCARAK